MHLVQKKARLVICGNKQQAGIDYFETFASVLQYTTLRILLAKAATEDLKADYVDINIVFLNLNLKEEVYIKVLEFLKQVYFKLKTLGAFLKLNKLLYRLKQALKA